MDKCYFPEYVSDILSIYLFSKNDSNDVVLTKSSNFFFYVLLLFRTCW